MLRNASSRIAPLHSLRGFRPIVDTAPHRPLSIENLSSPKRPSPPPYSRPRNPSREAESSDPRRRSTERQKNEVGVRYMDEPPSEKRLLRPSVLSERLKKLSDMGKLEDAVTMLKNAPLDAQNAVVWNTMISCCMHERRYKLAYQLYIDMKRRGFSPTIRTFQSLMCGYGKIDDWRVYSKQLDNVHTLMQNFKLWVDVTDVSQLNPREQELVISQYCLYIRILGDARLYQKMFDVYYTVEQEGKVHPDIYLYATMLHALSERRVMEGLPTEAVLTQNASDAKLIWKQTVKAAEKYGFGLNSYALTGVLRCLTRGRPSDTLLAFEIIRDWCGLAKPGEDAPPAKFVLNPHVVGAILELCNHNQKYRLAIHYVQQIMDRPLKKGDTLPLDRGNMERVLQSYAFLASLGSISEADQALETLQWMLRQGVLDPALESKLRPSLETYSLVLVACWRGADWASATRTFELLTGCAGKDFLDGQTDAPKVVRRSAGKNLQPDSAILSAMLRTAIASKDLANMRQCLRMIDFYQAEEILASTLNSGAASGAVVSDSVAVRMRTHREKKDQQFYDFKLAKVIVDVVDKIIPRLGSKALATVTGAPEEDDSEASQSYVISEGERKRWSALRSKAKEVIRLVKSLKAPLETPRYEEDPLGSERGLAYTDQQVEWNMTRRSV